MTGYKPVFIYPFAVNGFLSVTQIIMIVYGHHLSDRFKVQIGFLLASILIIMLPFACNQEPSGAFWSCFSILLIFGVINGMMQGQVFGLASILPQKYMGAVMLGNGFSGITMTVLNAILLAILPGEVNYYLNALIFFSLACLILLICSFAFTILNR
jgi:hypothetical protein